MSVRDTQSQSREQEQTPCDMPQRPKPADTLSSSGHRQPCPSFDTHYCDRCEAQAKLLSKCEPPQTGKLRPGLSRQLAPRYLPGADEAGSLLRPHTRCAASTRRTRVYFCSPRLVSTYAPREVLSKASKWLSGLPYLSKNNFLRETGAPGIWPQGTSGIILPIRETGVA